MKPCKVLIEFTADTVVKGPEGPVAEFKMGDRVEAYPEQQNSWRVPQGYFPDFFVDATQARGIT
jgi:hypothetical protein